MTFTFFNMAWITDSGWPWSTEELDKQMRLGMLLKMQSFQNSVIMRDLDAVNPDYALNFVQRN